MHQKISSLPAKMVTYSKKFCWSSMFLLNVFNFEASHKECDVTQFCQLNLNSSFFSIVLNLLIYLQSVGLLYSVKVIEDTVRNHDEFSNIFSSKVLCL